MITSEKKAPIKIGIIGNMNNGNFAIMRYLRDLGFDAYLLLTSGDGKGHSSHFSPECDTWQIDKWRPYIIQTSIADDPISVFSFPVSFFLFLRSLIRNIKDNNKIVLHQVSPRQIGFEFSEFTHLIGSGISPSFLGRSNIPLSIFYPYSIGVEWLGDPVFLQKIKSKNPVTRFLVKSIIKKQTQGIKNAKNVICLDKSLTEQTFKNIDVSFTPLLCPMVYNQEVSTLNKEENIFSDLLVAISKSDFSILSHSRHLWARKNDIPEDEWRAQDKNNDWLIMGFAQLVKHNIIKNPLLILFEYGDDVEQSKCLCEELDINKNVIWLPTLERKYIMWILSKVDMGAGEFYELPHLLFGGTGYEVLASGKPLLQGFYFSPEDFEKTFNIPSPPLLAVRNSEELLGHLFEMAKSREARQRIGVESRIWFDKYCGVGLAKQWAEILRQ